MNLLRAVICMCLVLFSACQDNSDDIASSDSLPNENASGGISFPSSNATESIENSSEDENNQTETNTDNDKISSASSTESSQDIKITSTGSPNATSTQEISDDSNSSTPAGTSLEETTTRASEVTTKKVNTACELNPCRNGGTCVEDAVVPLLFSCICPAGYVGIRCGTVDRCTMDESGFICKNGTCAYSKDGLRRSCQCFAGMYWDENNKECRDPDPPCFPNPCMNGGVCVTEDYIPAHCDCPDGYLDRYCSVLDKCGDCERGSCILDDKNTTKVCKCSEGLYWNEDQQICLDITSPCDSNPCRNGGTCFATSDEEYNCTCGTSFSGESCEIEEMCGDCTQGTCVLSDDKKTRICHCNDGFYMEELSHTCKEISNICEPNPCSNDGICTLVPDNSYNCTCSEGYMGSNCDVRDMCIMDGGDAYCGNGTCWNNHDLGLYFCTCKDGEYFQYKERKCVNLDTCPLMDCGIRECTAGMCHCKENYKWNNATEVCEPDFCSSDPCPVGDMICIEGTGSTDYKCSCKEGFAYNGTHCNKAICSFPNFNLCNQYCSMNEDGYECSCDEDFELKEDNHTCYYVGNSTCSNKTCDNGFCVKKGDVETCICPTSYIEVNGTCTDMCTAGHLASGICPLDECEPQAENGFRCKCEENFILSKDKTTCMVRNLCQENEIGWKTCKDRNAECVIDQNATYGFMCHCGRGQVPTQGGVCRDICSIESNQRQCSIRGATCDLDSKDRFICKCPPFFKENEGDGKCTQQAAFSYTITLPISKSTYSTGNRKQRSLDPYVDYKKISRDVSVTFLDMFGSFTQANILSCKTASEYILCRIELQFKTEAKEDLKLLETTGVCLSRKNSNMCLIPPSLVLVKNRIIEDVVVEPTDPCDADIKNLVCGSETTCTSSLLQKSFNCSCKPGYFARRKNYPFGNIKSFIEMCADIDECAEGRPCPANSDCANTVGSYTCSCKPGFRNIEDSSGPSNPKCIAVCNPNPCTHGECSRRGDHGFDCKCDAGYAGTYCNLQDEHFKRARINTVIVGVVLGGILLITFILFAVCVSRLRKKKTLENPGHLYYNSTEMAERRRVEGGAVNNAFRRE